jgi:hypothetical protein
MSLVQTALEVGEAVFTVLAFAAAIVTLWSWFEYWTGAGAFMATRAVLSTLVCLALFGISIKLEASMEAV